MTQKTARKLGCTAVLVYLEDGDREHERLISFHHIGPNSPMLWEDDTTWQRLYEFLNDITVAHKCASIT